MTGDPDFERVAPDEGRYVTREWADVDWADAASEAELEMILSGILEQSEDRARDYLAMYGDAAWDRIRWASNEAEALLALDRPSPCLALAAVAAELAIRFLILRPLLGGIIFSDVLAERVAARVAGGRTSVDREMLPLISQHWGLRVETIRMSDGALLVPYLKGTLWPQRDALMHQGQQVSQADARRACEGFRLIIDQIVDPLSRRLHLPWPRQRWSFPTEVERSPFVREATP